MKQDFLPWIATFFPPLLDLAIGWQWPPLMRILPCLFAIAILDNCPEYTSLSYGFQVKYNGRKGYWFIISIAATTIAFIFSLSISFLFEKPDSTIIKEDSASFHQFYSWVWTACILYPVIEEFIYRAFFCSLVYKLADEKNAIILSGSFFAVLHFRYGNPSPFNFVAGYFLAWVYLKGNNIIFPVMLHSFGNMLLIAIFYFSIH